MQKSALRLASLQGLATGKFCTAGFIYRYSAFGVTVSVYSQTHDTAPTGALLVDVILVSIPIPSCILAYRLQLRDAKESPTPGEPTEARHRQILHSRLYLPLLCFWCDCFRVFTTACNRAHGGAIFFDLFKEKHTSFLFYAAEGGERSSFAWRLTLASRRFTPKAPVRLHKRTITTKSSAQADTS